MPPADGAVVRELYPGGGGKPKKPGPSMPVEYLTLASKAVSSGLESPVTPSWLSSDVISPALVGIVLFVLPEGFGSML